jgi:hypothetical protein
VAATLGFIQASPTQIDITVNQTLAAYFPKDCVAGIAYALVTRGFLVFAALAQANNTNIYSLSNGQMVTYYPGFKLRMNDTDSGGAAIVPTATGYSIPLVAYYFDQATSTAYPVTILNASNAKIETAPWTQTTATISEQDKSSIAAKVDASTVLAKEVTSAAIKAKTDTLVNAPTTAQNASAVWNEVLSGATHNVAGSAGRRLRTLSDTVILIDGVGNTMSNVAGVGYITLPDATTVCIKQAIRVGDMVRYVRTFDPATKVATLDNPWCTVTAGNVDYTIFNGRESSLSTGPTLAEIEASTVLAKEASVQAVKSTTGLIPYLLVK